MILSLSLRVAACAGSDLLLDQQLLAWAEAEGFFELASGDDGLRNAVYLQHCHGLTGNLTGAQDFVRMLMPSARLSILWGGRRVHATADLLQGRGPRAVGGIDAANALIGAALAAWALDRFPAASRGATTALALEDAA